MDNGGVTKHGKPDMSRFRSKDTQLELRVRSYLHRKGLRFSLHRYELPGTPDVVLSSRGTIILVHGCFWHRHSKCKKGAYFPKNPEKGIEFWEDKFRKNVTRDQENINGLEKLGWNVDVVWECQSKDMAFLDRLVNKVRGRGSFKRRGKRVVRKSKQH